MRKSPWNVLPTDSRLSQHEWLIFCPWWLWFYPHSTARTDVFLTTATGWLNLGTSHLKSSMRFNSMPATISVTKLPAYLSTCLSKHHAKLVIIEIEREMICSTWRHVFFPTVIFPTQFSRPTTIQTIVKSGNFPDKFPDFPGKCREQKKNTETHLAGRRRPRRIKGSYRLAWLCPFFGCEQSVRPNSKPKPVTLICLRFNSRGLCPLDPCTCGGLSFNKGALPPWTPALAVGQWQPIQPKI